jgi:hypothetical protein
MNHDNDMNNDDEVTRQVEAIGAVAAAMMELMKQQALAHDHLSWTDMISAAAVACRGVAALAMANDLDLTLDQARTKMSKRFLQVMMLPPELVRIEKPAAGEEDQVIVVPVRRH